MTSNANPISAIELLTSSNPTPLKPESVAVVFGDDGFLREQALKILIEAANVESDWIYRFDGEEASWLSVHDELATISLFDAAEKKVAVVRHASKFISANRPQLERWVEKPPPNTLLILETETWLATTKLYKAIHASGTSIQASVPRLKRWGEPPDVGAIEKWIIAWGKKQHGLKLGSVQAERIVDLIGAEFGMLDNELAKLALFVDSKGHVTDETIRQAVGGWRKQTAWEIVDAVGDGDLAHALEQLARLIDSGEVVNALLPQMSWSFRRLGSAVQLIEQSERIGRPINLAQALAKVGVRAPDIPKIEKQMRRIGRNRGSKLLSWFLEADLKLKGSHGNDSRARFMLEELLLRLGDVEKTSISSK